MSTSDKTAYLSKSLYIRGLQCHKSLYLDRYQPELRGEPTPELEALWKSGHEVGDFAHMLFPGGGIVPFDGLTKDEQLAKTRISSFGSTCFSLLRRARRLRISTTVRSLIATGPCSMRYRSTSSEKDSFRYHLARALVSK